MGAERRTRVSAWLVVCLAFALLCTDLSPAFAHTSGYRVVRHVDPPVQMHAIAASRDGAVWVGGGSGLFRFDGWRYLRETQYPFPDALFLTVAADGRLWAGGSGGLAVRERSGQFRVVRNGSVYGLVSHGNTVFVHHQREPEALGVLVALTPEGGEHLIARSPDARVTVDADGVVHFIAGDGYFRFRPDNDEAERLGDVPAWLRKGVGRDQRQFADRQVLRLPDGTTWLANMSVAYEMDGGKGVLRSERRNGLAQVWTPYLVPGRDGEVWLLGDEVVGVKGGRRIPLPLREGSMVMQLTEDDRRHLWVTTSAPGLFEVVPEPGWETWSSQEVGVDEFIQVFRGPGGLFAATSHGLLQLDEAARAWRPFGDFRRKLAYGFQRPEGDFLLSVCDFGLIYADGQGRVRQRIEDLRWDFQRNYREILRDAAGQVWVANKAKLLRVTGEPGAMRLAVEEIPNTGEATVGVDLELDGQGRLWVGMDKGLAWRELDGDWKFAKVNQPFNSVRSFAFASEEEEIWLARRFRGWFSRLNRGKDGVWALTDFHPEDGYGPADTYFLKRDSRGWLWRGTNEGVFVARPGATGPDDWLHATIARGMAADNYTQYSFFEDRDGSVWLAGKEGVTRVVPRQEWFTAGSSAPTQLVSAVDADGTALDTGAGLPTGFEDRPARIRVRLSSIGQNPLRDRPLQYRLRPAFEDWRAAKEGEIVLQDLRDGDYHLEIADFSSARKAVQVWHFRYGMSVSDWINPLVRSAALVLFVSVVGVAILWWSEQLPVVRYRLSKAYYLYMRSTARDESFHEPEEVSMDRSGELVGGRYRLLRVVGKGGFSTVYEVADAASDDAHLALKLLSLRNGYETWLRSRFAHEVTALQSLRHEGIVPLLRSWVEPTGELCILMPFIDGVPLREILRTQAMDRRRLGCLLRHLGEALGHAHSMGIIHRDLKPENILVVDANTVNEHPVIVDFGTAGLLGNDEEIGITQVLAGSWDYLAPERLSYHYQASSDLYALAVIAMEAALGKLPKDLESRTPTERLAAELATIARRGGVGDPDGFADLLASGLAFDPADRPSDIAKWAGEVGTVLER